MGPTPLVAAIDATTTTSAVVPTTTLSAVAATGSLVADAMRPWKADWNATAAPPATQSPTRSGANSPTGRPTCVTTTAAVANSTACKRAAVIGRLPPGAM